jgi:FkbM family methyltransferase
MSVPGIFDTLIKKHNIDGINEWVWPNADSGLWTGPCAEWPAIKETFLANCKSKNTVVQAGGACGMYPKLLSLYFEQVYTFEPDAYNFYCLTQNCYEEKIHKFNCALGNTHKMINFTPPSNGNRGVGTINVETNGKTPLLMIDDFEFDKLDYIQLDVEGAEKFVIFGAEKSIKKHNPLISMETVHQETLSFLEDLGYVKIKDVQNDHFYMHKSQIEG